MRRSLLVHYAIAGDSTIHQCQQMNHSKVSAWLLSQFQAGVLLPDHNLEMVMVPTPHPRDGLQVKFQRLSVNVS